MRERLVEEQETTEEQRRDQSDRLERQMEDLEAELDECREREQNLEVLYLMRTKIKCYKFLLKTFRNYFFNINEHKLKLHIILLMENYFCDLFLELFINLVF